MGLPPTLSRRRQGFEFPWGYHLQITTRTAKSNVRSFGLFLAAVLTLVIVLSAMNYFYYRHEIQMINQAIRALDPAHPPTPADEAMLEKMVRERRNVPDEYHWLFWREAIIVFTAVGAIVARVRVKPRTATS
jgi:hypothetical protein